MDGGFGGYVRARREALGLSQAALAAAAGIARPYLSQIESGKIGLPNAQLRRELARILGVSHADLLVAAGELAASEVGRVIEVGPVAQLGPTERRLLALFAELSPLGRDAVMRAAEALVEAAADRRDAGAPPAGAVRGGCR